MKCGIDPGRYKIGFAIVENGKLLFSAIIPKSKEEVLAKAVKDNDWKLLEQWGKEGNVAAVSNMIAEKVLLGDGTSSNEIKSLLKETVNLEIVSEYETTLKGRELGVAVAEAMFELSKRIGFPMKLGDVEGFSNKYIEKALEAAKNPQLAMKLQNMPVPLTADMIDKYMRPILEAARDGDLSRIINA